MAAPATERWTATSRTATAITGDIDLSPTKLMAASKTFPLAVAADVAAFGTSGGPKPARIMRVTREVNPVLLHGNTLCSPAARWIALYRSDAGKGLTLAVFSGLSQPQGENDPSLCATYSHVLAQKGTSGFQLIHKPYSIEELSRTLRKASAWRQHGRSRQH